MSSTSLSVWSKDLGSYESTERAKEILNEIFTKIEVSNGLAVTYKALKQLIENFNKLLLSLVSCLSLC